MPIGSMTSHTQTRLRGPWTLGPEPEALGTLQDSMTFWYRLLGVNIRMIRPNFDGQFLHSAVRERLQGTTDYRPPNVPWPWQ